MGLFMFLAFLMGTFIPLQANINTSLATKLGHPIPAAFISFLVGTLALFILLSFSSYPLASLKKVIGVPPHLLIGGLLGATMVGMALVIVPKIGVATMIALLVTGQLFFSLVIDHYGFFGLTRIPINSGRIIGALFMLIGVLFIQFKK